MALHLLLSDTSGKFDNSKYCLWHASSPHTFDRYVAYQLCKRSLHIQPTWLHVSPTHCPEQSSVEPAGPRLWPSSSLWWLSGGGSFGKSTPLTPGTSSSFYYQFSSDNCWLWSFKFCYIYTCIAKTSRISVALSCEHLSILYLSMGVSIPATNYLPSAVHWPALQLMWSHPLPHHLGLLRCLKNQTQYIVYPLSMHRLHDYKM